MSDERPGPLDPEEREMEEMLRRLGPERAPEPIPIRAPRPHARRWGRLAAAASVVAALGAAFFFLKPGEEEAAVRHLPVGIAIRGSGEEVASGPAEERVVSLPDGSRFRIDPGSRVRFAPAGTDRVRVELLSGSLAADVVKGNRAVRIASEAGEVVVVGTWFRVKAFRMHPVPVEKETPSPSMGEGQGGGGIPVLSVEVDEGLVELSGAGDAIPVPAGRRGLILGRSAPVLQEQKAQTWETALAAVGGAWESPGFGAGRVAATLLAADWEGLARRGGWRGILGDPSVEAALRRPAAFLVALAAESEDAENLLVRYAEEKDPEVRAILRPHLVRIAGEEAVGAMEKAFDR